MTISAQSRIKVLETPILAPGTCSLCGSAGDGKRTFIDFGKQLDWYGAVYFCSECICEASLAIGYIPVASFEKLHNDHRALQIELDQLVKRHEAVSNALSILLANSNVSVDDFVQSIVPPVEESTEFEFPNAESTEGDTETNESSDVEGSDDLFDATDFE